MKKEIHPTYYPEAQVICACGNTWTTGSTSEVIRTDVCSKCHTFFTGEQRIVDTEGQVDRFYKKLQAREEYIQELEEREATRVSPDRKVEELELSKRATSALKNDGLEKNVLSSLLGDLLSCFAAKLLAPLPAAPEMSLCPKARSPRSNPSIGRSQRRRGSRWQTASPGNRRCRNSAPGGLPLWSKAGYPCQEDRLTRSLP